jgi:hypothetical protein
LTLPCFGDGGFDARIAGDAGLGDPSFLAAAIGCFPLLSLLVPVLLLPVRARLPPRLGVGADDSELSVLRPSEAEEADASESDFARTDFDRDRGRAGERERRLPSAAAFASSEAEGPADEADDEEDDAEDFPPVVAFSCRWMAWRRLTWWFWTISNNFGQSI